MRFILRGRRSISPSWIMIPVAPRTVTDGSCEMRINHEIHFAWQAQYLVKLEGDFSCSVHCNGRFICAYFVLDSTGLRKDNRLHWMAFACLTVFASPRTRSSTTSQLCFCMPSANMAAEVGRSDRCLCFKCL